MCRATATPSSTGPLYLPKDWTDAPARMKAAHVPAEVGFATKPQIARAMIKRAIAAKVPFRFVAADSVYGTGEIETPASQSGQGLCFGCCLKSCVQLPGAREHLFVGARPSSLQKLPKTAWRRLSSGEGTKGPRRHDWRPISNWPDLDASEYSITVSGAWTRGLLIRRNIVDGDLAFFSTGVPRTRP